MIKKARKKTGKFLRWSQKYTKTDMIYLAKGGFWLNLGKIINSIASLGLAVAFANLLPAETYGTFRFIISFVPILSIPTLKGMNQAIVRAVSQGNEGTFYPALKTKIRWGAWGAVGTLVLALYYFYNQNNTLGISFLMMAAFIPFINTLNVWMQYLNGKRKFKILTQYKNFLKISVVSIIIFVLFFSKNIFIILLTHLTANLLIETILLLIILKKYPPNEKKDPASIGYGKHLSLMGILGTVATRIDMILLFHYLGPTQLAIYTFSLKPIEELKKPLSSLKELTMPKLSQRDIGQLKKSLPPRMIKLFLFLIPVVILYFFIAPQFYKFLFPQYTESIIYSQVFALTIFFFPGSFMAQTMDAHAKKKQLYILRTVIPTFKIILFFILLPIYGIWGAIITTLITGSIGFFFSLFLFIKTKS